MARGRQFGVSGFGANWVQDDNLAAIDRILKTYKGIPTSVRQGVMKEMAQELLEASLLLAPEDLDRPAVRGRGDSRRAGWDDRGYQPLKQSANIFKAGGTWIVRYQTRHAPAQHERMDYVRDRGQAKFLEQPLMSMRAEYPRRIGKSVARQMAERARRAGA